MPTYRIDVPHNGRAILQTIEDHSLDVVFLFDNGGAVVVNEVAKHGVSALQDNPDFAHLLDVTEGKPLKEIRPNISPIQHALIFG